MYYKTFRDKSPESMSGNTCASNDAPIQCAAFCPSTWLIYMCKRSVISQGNSGTLAPFTDDVHLVRNTMMLIQLCFVCRSFLVKICFASSLFTFVSCCHVVRAALAL